MQHFLKIFLVFGAAIILAACGGGGGGSSTGGGATGGTPPPPAPAPVETDTLTLSAGTVNFAATQFEAIPDPIAGTATITGSNTAGIVFGTLPGVEGLPFWLEVELGDIVDNSVDAVFRVTRTDLPEGNYTFTVRAATFDENENVLDTADVDINFDVAEGVPLSVTPESVDVLMHFASHPISEVISVNSGNYEWSAFSSDANLDVETATGPQDLTLSIFPPMRDLVDADGTYQGSVEILQNGTTNNTNFLINFTVVPTLEDFGGEVFFNAVAGEAEVGDIGVNLKGQGLNWAVTSDVPWLSFSAASGIIETDDLLVDSPDGDDFTASVNGTTLTAGVHTATITVTADADQTLEIPVRVEVAPQIITASKRGIAFSDTPDGSALQAAVNINTNVSRTAAWTASSNQSWLTVTPSGTSDDALVVSADPSALVNETTSFAVITLSSPDDEIANTIDINVGLWKSALSSPDVPVNVDGLFPEDLIVADPIRPLAYVHSSETEINIVNVYSGVIENTLIPTGRVFNFDVSDDGAFLYLVRSGEGEGFIDVVDLETQIVTMTFTYPSDRLQPRDTQDVRFGRISNTPYLFVSEEVAINAATGETQAIFNKFPSSLEVRNNVFCGDTANVFQPDFGCLNLVTAGFEGARVTSVVRGTGETTGGQLILTQNGDRLFTVDRRRVISVYDTSDLSLIATIETAPEDFVEEAELDSNDNLYVTYRNDGEVPTDIDSPFIDPRRFYTVFDRNLVELRSVDYPSEAGGALSSLQATALSGDDQRIIFLRQEFATGALEVNLFSVD